MRRVVHKFDFEDEHQEFPAGKIVLFGPDRRGCVCVWIERVEHSISQQALRVFGTGHEVPDGYEHIASCKDSAMIWHLYRLNTPESGERDAQV